MYDKIKERKGRKEEAEWEQERERLMQKSWKRQK